MPTRKIVIIVVVLLSMLIASSALAQEQLPTCTLPADPPMACAVVKIAPAGLIGDYYLGDQPLAVQLPAAGLFDF